jgi:uncharacterized RDD family membrane protein YckC
MAIFSDKLRMVFQDINQTFELSSVGQAQAPAKVVDRVFSFVIDYLVLSPFVLFILYFSFNNGFVYAKSNPLAPENDFFYVLMGLSFLILFSFFQVCFVRLWQATPGQYFLKLKFEFDEDNSLNLLRLFFRQIMFWCGFLFLGIPFLSVMTNTRRRTFYDQIADVSVVSCKKEVYHLGFEHEFKYWRAMMATLTTFFVFLMSSFIWSNYERVVGRVGSFAQMQEQNFFCPELKSVEMARRLETAIALNLVNQISDVCLDREADFVLWKQKFDNYSLAYYAKSLTTDDNEKEIKYLDQACAGQDVSDFKNLNFGCKIAKSFKEANYENLYESLSEVNILSDILKYELAQQLAKNEDIGGLLAAIGQYENVKGAKKYQLLEMLSQAGQQDEVSKRAPASTEPEIEAFSKIKLPVNVITPKESSKDYERIIQLVEEL